MKKFKEFIVESSVKWVNLNGVYIRKHGGFPSISYLNSKIAEYIENVYSKYGFVKNINPILKVKGVEINIQFMINNYLIFKKFIDYNNIKNASDFVNELINNFDNVYHYDGEFFNKNTKWILKNTRKSGLNAEKIAFKKFEDFSKSKGLDMEIKVPTTDEDIGGTDGYFEYKGKKYTIQVKPFSSLIDMENYIKAESDGSLSLNTDFLILYKGDKHIFVKNKEKDPIRIKSKFFIFNKNNVVFNDYV